jgi:hypothetical protein
LTGSQGAKDPRLGDVLGGVAVRHGRGRDAVPAGKLGEHARILADDQVGRVQDVECTQRDVTHIADRRGNNMQARRQRRFTRPLPIASL